MNIQTGIIYHILSSEDFKSFIIGSMYAPESLIHDGFIHCTSLAETALLAAENLYDKIEGSVYLMKIIVDAVLAPVRFEISSKYEPEILFPHIYGSLNLDAVEGIGLLTRSGAKFLWPDFFHTDLDMFK